MLPSPVTEGLALAIYAWIVVCLIYGRPRLPRRSASEVLPEAQGGSVPLEVVWLAALAAAFSYPLVVLLAPTTLLARPFALQLAGDELVQVVGFTMVLVGGGILGSAFRALGRFATVRIEISRDHWIVREGPYARVRHPMYTANMLLSAGIALTFLSVVLWLPVLIIVLVARWRAGEEERVIVSSPRLRTEYEAYSARTGRFLPRWSRARDGPGSTH